MKKMFLAAILGMLICSLAFGATEIRQTGMYVNTGLGVTGDHRLGNTCVTSAGGRYYCGLNASHLSFFADNTVSLELLYQLALASDNGVNGYFLRSNGDNTFTWAAASGTPADNSVSSAKLLNLGGTPSATTFFRGDNTWSVPPGSTTLPWDNITGTDNVIGTTQLMATGTPDNTTYFRGDNTWSTPAGGATPAGSTGHIQYNDNGALGAVPGTGYSPADNSVSFPGAVISGDPGDGNRRMSLLNNTSDFSGDNTLSLGFIDNTLYVGINGVAYLVTVGARYGVLETFNNSSIDNTLWTVVTAGSGTATESNDNVSLVSGADADGVILVHKDNVTKTTRTYKVDFQMAEINGTGNFTHPVQIAATASTPTITDWNTFTASGILFIGVNGTTHPNTTISYADNAGNWQYHGADVDYAYSSSTYYRFHLQTSTTQWRAWITTVDEGTTIHAGGGWTNWSATRDNSNTMKMCLGGDHLTNYSYGTTRFNRFERVP